MDPVWLLKAGAATLLGAALLAYGSLCAYIFYGAWETLLRPVAAITATPAEPYTPVRFDAAETGTPRLTGWWIPADASGSVAASAQTLLMLHGGDGSLSTAASVLDELHQAGVNIFAIDYRGYGQSQGPHPSEQRMMQDSSAALNYLVDTRHIPAATIVPYGIGLGAVFAAQLAKDHAELRAVVIDNPWPNAAEHVIHDPHYRFLPIALLLPDRFDLEEPLNGMEKPKLLISGGPGAAESRHAIPAIQPDPYTTAGRLNAYFRSISEPKMIVSGIAVQSEAPAEKDAIPARNANDARLSQALSRFLDEYLPRPRPATP